MLGPSHTYDEMSIGIQFPFAPATGSDGYFAGSDTVPQAIIQNARSLLATNWGERVMQPNLGCNLIEFCFEQLSIANLQSRVADRISSQFNRWMPFLDVISVTVTPGAPRTGNSDNSFNVNVRLGYGNSVIDVSQLIAA